jgi:hypothetical protein
MRVELEVSALVSEEVWIVQVVSEEMWFFVTTNRNVRVKTKIVVRGRCSRPGRTHEKEIRPSHL